MSYLTIIEKLKNNQEVGNCSQSATASVYEKDEKNEKCAQAASTEGGSPATPCHPDGQQSGDKHIPQQVAVEHLPTSQPVELPTRRCYACKSWLFWVSIHGAMACATCHAPANPELVKDWYWLPAAECKKIQ